MTSRSNVAMISFLFIANATWTTGEAVAKMISN